MKTFHHGGRIGDMVFALYTMKALGGGKLYVSDYHHPNWSLDVARSMHAFLRYQDYISDVEYIRHSDLPKLRVDYDLQKAEDDYNPEAFPEWDGKNWPSNCNIRKRYAVHFGVPFELDATWITAPDDVFCEAIAIHLPSYRLVRSVEDWIDIVADLYDLVGYCSLGLNIKDLLNTAAHINACAVFLGAVSSCNAIAEGLGKMRFVEQAPDCYNVNVPKGYCINDWSNREVVAFVYEACKKCDWP